MDEEKDQKENKKRERYRGENSHDFEKLVIKDKEVRRVRLELKNGIFLV